MSEILQIVPRVPGGRDGVGDYARTLARRLQESHGRPTTFLPGQALKDLPELPAAAAIILHYVNYGYDRRGLPAWLPALLRRRRGPARLITIFHELYATGSWRQSAFWLQPWQKRIARSIAELSDTAIVSSEVLQQQLAGLTTSAPIIVHPVFSNFGEPAPAPASLAARAPQSWVICGGTELVERSLRSFLQVAAEIAPPFAPRELFVIGGADNARLRSLLRAQSGFKTHYHPEVAAAEASRILSACAFGWVDYFVQAAVPTSAVLKSTAFAACCAHGVIPVFPARGSAITLGGDALPGPFFVTSSGQSLPGEPERAAVAYSHQSWYQRHASSAHLAATVANALAS